jgi:hypothetical protein
MGCTNSRPLQPSTGVSTDSPQNIVKSCVNTDGSAPTSVQHGLNVGATQDLSTASLPDDLLSPTTSDGESPTFLDDFEPNVPAEVPDQPLAIDTTVAPKRPIRRVGGMAQPSTPGSSTGPRSPRVFLTVTKPQQDGTETPAAPEASLARGKSARVIITTGSKRTVLNVDTSDPANLVKAVEVTRIPSVGSMAGSIGDNESVFSDAASLPVLSPARSERSLRDEAVHVTRRLNGGVPSTTVSTPLGSHSRQTSPLKPRQQPPPIPMQASSGRSRSPVPTRGTSPPLHHHPRSDEACLRPSGHSHTSLSRALHLQEAEVIRVQTLLDAAVQQRVRACIALQEAKSNAGAAGVSKQRQAAVSTAMAQVTAREKQEDRLRARLQREIMLKEALVVDTAAAEVHERVKAARLQGACDTRYVECKPSEDKRGWSPAGSLFSPSDAQVIAAVPMSPAVIGSDT